MSLFDARYNNDDTGRKAISPKILLKIVLFGYSRGLLTSRSLEQACHENITFMALACGLKPDHSTIAAFASSLKKEIKPLFTKVLLICDEEGLLGGTHFSLMVDEKHQVVLHAEALGKGNDSTAMKSMLEGAKETLETIGWEEPLKDRIISADTGYYSIKNLHHCKELEVDAFVPDPHFRKRDVRFEDARRYRRPVDRKKQKYTSKKRFFGVEDFILDEASGKLICPAGHGLYVKNRNFVMRGGLRAIAYQAPKTACRDCALRSQIKVGIQWMLYCLVHNIEKIANYGSTYFDGSRIKNGNKLCSCANNML